MCHKVTQNTNLLHEPCNKAEPCNKFITGFTWLKTWKGHETIEVGLTQPVRSQDSRNNKVKPINLLNSFIIYHIIIRNKKLELHNSKHMKRTWNGQIRPNSPLHSRNSSKNKVISINIHNNIYTISHIICHFIVYTTY